MNMHVTLGRNVYPWLETQPAAVQAAFWSALRRLTESESTLISMSTMTTLPGEKYVYRIFQFASFVAVFQWDQLQQRVKVVGCRPQR